MTRVERAILKSYPSCSVALVFRIVCSRFSFVHVFSRSLSLSLISRQSLLLHISSISYCILLRCDILFSSFACFSPFSSPFLTIFFLFPHLVFLSIYFVFALPSLFFCSWFSLFSMDFTLYLLFFLIYLSSSFFQKIAREGALVKGIC